MKKHLDEGLIQALLDGELPPAERAHAEAHLASCAECAAEVRSLRSVNERMGSLFAQADAAPPVAQAQMAFRRRRMAAGQRSGEARRAFLRAAALVLGMAGVAAASVPGSPVREWIAETVLPAERAPQAPAVEAAPAAAPAPPVAEAPAGVFIRPSDGSVRVVLTGARRGLTVRVRVGEVEDAQVSATGEARGARFRTSAGRIEVAGATAGEVTIVLPRGADAAQVQVNGRVWWVKEGAALRGVAAPVAGPSASEAVFRVGA